MNTYGYKINIASNTAKSIKLKQKFGNYQEYLSTMKDDLSETNGLNQGSIGEIELDTTNYI